MQRSDLSIRRTQPSLVRRPRHHIMGRNDVDFARGRRPSRSRWGSPREPPRSQQLLLQPATKPGLQTQASRSTLGTCPVRESVAIKHVLQQTPGDGEEVIHLPGAVCIHRRGHTRATNSVLESGVNHLLRFPVPISLNDKRRSPGTRHLAQPLNKCRVNLAGKKR